MNISWRWLSLIGSCLFFSVLIFQVQGKEVLLAPHENITLENCTLILEDADSQEGKVWVSFSCDQDAPVSSVLGLGEPNRFGRLTLVVKRIYAGDGRDLVALDIW
ncbi:Uncharacterised protein [uncultured archaeon]|nr:Uncharacterised protein [uncultured archaeon]